MTIDILRRTGGWVIELAYPLKSRGGEITQIEIRRPTADAVIRWGKWEIPSTLALLAELCGLPEKVIRQLPNDDFDRVMFALINTVGPIIKGDIEAGNRPLASEEEQLPEAERGVPLPDPIDPRFPAVDGPVRRISKAPQQPSQPELEGGAAEMNMAAPATIAPVH